MQLSNRPIQGTFLFFCVLVLWTLFWIPHDRWDVALRTVPMTAFAESPTEKGGGKMQNDNHQHDLAIQIKTLHESGEFDKALEISRRALKTNPPDLEAYDARWRLIAKMFSEKEAKKIVYPEIEFLLKTYPETLELLKAAYWGYKCLPGRAKNVPSSLFDKMLQYSRTEIYLSALLGLAQRSEDTRQQWHYYERLINECTVSDGPSSWYMLAHEEMLWLAEDDRTLTSDDYLDKIIERLLKAHLFMCQETQQYFGWAYTDSVKYRLKFNIRLDKALATLERAEIRLEEKEEQKWLVEHNEGSIEEARMHISRLRAEIHLQQERWREAHEGLLANAPDFLESVWARFNKEAINYFHMLGQSAEKMGEWKTARRYYADAHFAPTPHTDALAGLQRIYHQMEQETTYTFKVFLKDAEAEYRTREGRDIEKIRQKLITNKLDKKATDFQFKTLQGETHTLSAMTGKVVLLDLGASWCGPCNRVIPDIKAVYERFRKNDEVVVWGINDGETPQKVQKFLEEHQPPWPVLLDTHQEVRKAYQIKGIPFFILIDKAGNWQYSFLGSHLINGQPLIWMIETLLSD